MALFAWLETWFRSPDFRGCIYIRAAGEYPEKADKPHQAALQFKTAWRGLLIMLCRQAGAADADTLGRQIALLMEGAMVTAFIEGRPEAAQAAQAAAVTLLAAAPRI